MVAANLKWMAHRNQSDTQTHAQISLLGLWCVLGPLPLIHHLISLDTQRFSLLLSAQRQKTPQLTQRGYPFPTTSALRSKSPILQAKTPRSDSETQSS